MKIYSPDIVSSVKHQDTKQGASTQIVLHDHTNKPILDQFSIAEDGSLQFGGTDVHSRSRKFCTGEESNLIFSVLES